jgi:hypothetical protein
LETAPKSLTSGKQHDGAVEDTAAAWGRCCCHATLCRVVKHLIIGRNVARRGPSPQLPLVSPRPAAVGSSRGDCVLRNSSAAARTRRYSFVSNLLFRSKCSAHVLIRQGSPLQDCRGTMLGCSSALPRSSSAKSGVSSAARRSKQFREIASQRFATSRKYLASAIRHPRDWPRRTAATQCGSFEDSLWSRLLNEVISYCPSSRATFANLEGDLPHRRGRMTKSIWRGRIRDRVWKAFIALAGPPVNWCGACAEEAEVRSEGVLPRPSGRCRDRQLASERGLHRTSPVFTGCVPSSSNRSDASSARLRASHEIGRPAKDRPRSGGCCPGEPRRGRSGSLSLK